MAGKRLPDEIYNARWLARITSKCVRSESGCLLWQGIRTWNGYAQDQYRMKTRTLHRKMYEVTHDVTLPRDIDVCHSCDVRHCIEPSHLWTGTRKQNVDDMTAKARHWSKVKTHCKHGHEFTPENTEIRQSRGKPGQGRACKTCMRIRSRVSAGWPKGLAETLGITPKGYRPVKGRFPRKKKAATPVR